MWIQYGYRIEEAEKKKEQVAEVMRQLRTERASLRSTRRIDSIARNQLGMIALPASQVLILSADAPLTIPAPGRVPGQQQLAARR